MTAPCPDWVTVPYGPGHRAEMEKMAGGDYDPANGKHGIDWNKARHNAPYVRMNGIGYNGIYAEVFGLPDGRVMIRRWDKYAPYSKFIVFASADECRAWCDARNKTCPEIDPETGRPFRQ